MKTHASLRTSVHPAAYKRTVSHLRWLILCLMVSLSSVLHAQSPAHVYDFNGSFADSMGGSAMVSGGGTLGASTYSFAAGQGPNVSNVLSNTGEYTIEMVVRFDFVDSYRCILNFNARTADTAFYCLNGAVSFYSYSGTASSSLVAGQTHRIVMTRNASTQVSTAYVDGVQKLQVTDINNYYVASASGGVLHFFRDDVNEDSSGFVDQIRIYNSVLTPAQVAALSNAVAPTVTSPTSASITGSTATLGGNVTSDGGATITERGVVYAATATNNNPSIGGSGVTKVTASGTTGVFTASVTGLLGSTGYSFKAYATNSQGTSYTSAATFTTLAATVPGAPTIGTATGGNASASVTFTAPASNGGSAITGYTVTSSPGGFTGTGAASPITVNGLTNGTAYTFTVTATNAVGTGSASAASNSVTPATVPGAPTIGAATAGNASASVTFTAPVSNGGSAITSYTVTSSPGNLTGTGSASPISVTGLTNGTAYTFTVKATNAVGAGASSAASNSVTPNPPPTVSSISPTTGSNAGGTSVTITGSNFTGATGVTIGGTAATSVTVVNSTTITCTTPAGSVGTASVVVTTPQGANAVNSLYTYGTLIGDVTATYTTATDVPLTSSNPLLNGGTATLALGYAPVTGTTLMVVKNTGLGFISGTFSNLTQGQTVTLSFGGVTYNFVVNYYGGTGNDLVLVWKNSRLLAWGNNIVGKLGNNTTTNSLVPVAVTTSGVLSGKTVLTAAAGNDHSVALCSDGTVATWGNNSYGQLGNNSTTQSLVPVAVTTSGVLAGKTVVTVSAGYAHSVALCSDGTVATWGYNSNGQLGNNSTTQSTVPVAVTATGVLAGKTVVAIAAGYYHNLALCSDGTLAVWGWNDYGQFGDNSITSSTVPVAVPMTGVLSGKTVVAVAAGFTHSLALCSDGTVAAWGRNSSGQLGISNGWAQSNVPVTVTTTGVLSGKTVVAIASGYEHSLARCSDGTLAAWGHNSYGELGNNSIADSMLPVAVTTSGVLSGKTPMTVAAGNRHSLSLCTDGTLAAWGTDYEGELGNNSTTSSSVPVLVNTSALVVGERITQAMSGPIGYHSFAVVATPPPTLPTVTTPTSASVTASAASLGGNVTSQGGATITERGVVYAATATNSNPSIGGTGVTKVTASGTTGIFTAAVSGLSGHTGYTFKAYATNAGGTGYSSAGTFTTLNNPPTAPNGTATGTTGDQKTVTVTFPTTDVDGDAVAISAAASGTGVTVNSFTGTTVTFTPGSSFTGSGSFTYTVSDGNGGTATGTITVTVSDNDSPAVAAHANVTAEATSAAGATVTYAAGSATDNVTASPTITYSQNSGTVFPIGVTTVTISATDAANNTGTGTFTVTVVDTTAPVVAAHAAVTMVATGPSGAVVTYAAGSATDAVTASPTITYSKNSGTLFPIGVTTVTIFATDAANNTGTGTFTVTVTQANPPVITLLGTNPLTVEAAASYTDAGATASDVEDGPLTPSITSNTVVANVPGTYAVTWTATDSNSNTGSATRVVNVVDTTAPVVAAHANVTAEATSAAGATVTYTAGSATDFVTTSPTITYSQNSGTIFPIGVTTVTISAKDAANNTGTTTFTVTVSDTIAPAVAAHANVGPIEATSAAGATVTYTAGSATDAVTTSPTITYSQNSGTTFPIGVTTVTISAKDAANNTGTRTFTVTVVDTTAPVIATHVNVAAEATSAAGASVTYASASVTDTVGVSTVTYSQNSGTVFPLGVTTVTITAKDAANNTSTSTFTVTVSDTIAPAIATHVNVTAEATSAAGATVSYAPADATDAVGVTSLTYSKNSGTVFPIGTTTVTITAKDAVNHTTTSTFTVTVADTTAPAIAAHANVTVNSTSTAGATVTYDPASAPDAVTASPTITYSKNSGTVFPIGVTTVTITAKDAVNNTSTSTFTVTVLDANVYAAWSSPSTVPITANGYTATDKFLVTTLNFAPTAGVNLTVVNNAGLGFIAGQFSNVANGSVVNLSNNGITYPFVAWYYGGDGNDLVLLWAGTELSAWGANASGQLGVGSTSNRLVPTSVGGVLAGKTIVQVAPGGSHTLALTSEGKVYAWGANANGQLGDSSTTDRTTPVAVTTAAGSALAGKFVIAIAGGDTHSLALCSDGTVAAWGSNGTGQLGDNTTTNRSVPVVVNAVSGTSALSGRTAAGIAAGQGFSLARCTDGKVAAWGTNTLGQLGDDTNTQRNAPVLVSFSSSIIAIAAGSAHSLAINTDRFALAWGSNQSSQLGDGTTTNRKTPVFVYAGSGSALLFQQITAIAAGASHSMALLTTLRIATWGNNADGQLGYSGNNSGIPSDVGINGQNSKGIAAGGSHSYAGYGSILLAWGKGTSGALGDNSQTSHSEPMAVNRSNLSSLQGLAIGALPVSSMSGASFVIGLRPVVEIEVEQPAGTPLVSNNTTPLDGGAAVVGTSAAAKTVTIRNIGSGTLPLTSITIDGTDAADFVLGTSTVPSALAPGSSAVFTVVFQPVVGASTNRTAMIRILSKDADEPSFNILVRGNASFPTTTTVDSVTNTYSSGGSGPSSVALHASVSASPAAAPTQGAVTFEVWRGTTQVGSAVSGSVFYGNAKPTFYLPPGTIPGKLTIKATYSGGTNYDAGTMATGTLTITPASLTVYVNTFQRRFGEANPTLTGSVFGVQPGDTVGANYQTTATAASPVGTYAITGGPLTGASAANYQMTSMNPGTLTILPAITSTVAANVTVPTSLTSQTVTLSAVVTNSATNARVTTGTVRFTNVPFGIGPIDATLNASGEAKANLTIPANTRVGGYTLNASYLGDGNHNASNGTIQLRIEQAAVAKLEISRAAGASGPVTAGDVITFQVIARDASNTIIPYTGKVSFTSSDAAAALPAGATYFLTDAGQRSFSARLRTAGTQSITVTDADNGLSGTLGGLTVNARTAIGNTVLYAWGNGEDGRLGNGGTTDASSLVRLQDMGELQDFTTGGRHSVVVKADKRAWSWGFNGSGQLANGTKTNSMTPVPALRGANQYLEDIIAVSAGANHTLAITSDKTVWAWGDTTSGQLGIGNVSDALKKYATQTTGLSNVVAVAAGGSHSVALSTDNVLFAWGSNSYGQVGNSSATDAKTPQQILTGVMAIAAGRNHTVALMTDGSVQAWGLNSNGQLGDASNTKRNAPVRVRGFGGIGFLGGVVAIAAGGEHTLALLNNGAVFAWGGNWTGQLGNGTCQESNVPVPVSVKPPSALNGTPVVAIAAGSTHSVALLSNGVVATWGAGARGQLGNGTTSSTLPSPRQATGDLPGGKIVSSSSSEHTLGAVSLSNAARFVVAPNRTGEVGVASPITVSVVDADNNSVAYTGTVSITSPSNATFTVQGGATTFAATDQGTKAFNVTLLSTGSQTIRFRDPKLPGLDASVTINVSGSSTIKSASTKSLKAGSGVAALTSNTLATNAFSSGTFGAGQTQFAPLIRNKVSPSGGALSETTTEDQTVILTAYVNADGQTANDGVITFQIVDGLGNTIGTPVTSGRVTGGVATAPYVIPAGTAVGVYSIIVTYSGGETVQGSTGSGGFLRVGQPDVEMLTTVADAQAIYSLAPQSVDLSANVTANNNGVNEGTLIFRILDTGGNVIQAAVESGVLVNGDGSVSYLLPAGLPAGIYTIEAGYTGSATFEASAGTATLAIGPAPLTIEAYSALTVATRASQTVGLDALVTSPAGSLNEGTVIFTIVDGDGAVVGTPVTSETLADGATHVWYDLPANLPAGNYAILAHYVGTANVEANSDQTQALVVQFVAAPTFITAANVSVSESNSAQDVTLSASLGSSLPDPVDEGNVIFQLTRDGVNVGNASASTAVANGQATVTYQLPPGITSGTYLIQASYTGGSFFQPETGFGALSALSINAKLAGLLPNAGTLSPTFDSAITSYTASVSNDTTSITVSPSVSEPHATFTVNGGAATTPINLTLGANVISILVTAENGTSQQLYTINLRRQSGFESWRAANGASNTAANLQRFAFGLSPTGSGEGNITLSGGSIISDGFPTVNIVKNSSSFSYYAMFGRRKDWASAGLSFSVQFSGDLNTWVTSTATPTPIASDADSDAVIVRYPFFVNGKKAQFFRVVVSDTVAP